MVSPAQPGRLSKVQRFESVAARTYRELRRALLRGVIVPGQRLVEAELAQQLGVSRTPVREALARLVAEGLVAVLPQGGLVARDTGGELADIYGLRQVLEGYAARLAAARIEPHELDRLDELARQMQEAEESGALDRAAEINTAFHLQIARASRSPRLISMIDDYREYFLSADVLSLYDGAALRHSRQQHEEIVAALRAGDGEEAERLVRAHFQDAMAIILEHSAISR